MRTMRSERVPCDYADEYLPRILSSRWRLVSETEDGAMYQSTRMRVICSVATELDGGLWLHISASAGWTTRGASRIPNYEELKEIKTQFGGADRPAYHVFPPSRTHVNINPHVLHLFVPLNDAAIRLPEFSRTLSGVRTL